MLCTKASKISTPNSETSCHASKARPTPPTFATRANHQPASTQVESDTRSSARKPKIPSEHSTQATVMRAAASMSSSTSANPHWPVLGPQPPTSSGAVQLTPLKSAVPAPASASSGSTTAVSSASSSYYSSSSSSSPASSPTRWKEAAASNIGTVRRSDRVPQKRAGSDGFDLFRDEKKRNEKKLLKLALANSLVETKWTRAKPLPHARVFRPTLDEFADPIQYIAQYVLVVLCTVCCIRC